MSKRPNLAAARNDVGTKSVRGAVPAGFAVLKTEPESEASVSARPPSRTGLRAITCYVKPEAHKQLRMLGLEKGASVQDLMTEALNDLFRKYERTRIA